MMKKVIVFIVLFCLNLRGMQHMQHEKDRSTCKTCMRATGIGCASASVSGCGMYVGGLLAHEGLVSTAVVVNLGAGLMCGGLLGALVGASCPLDDEHSHVSRHVIPTPVSMSYDPKTQAVVPECK